MQNACTKSNYRYWPVACEVEGIILQFCYLSVMLWLNAMSFELWSKFRKLRTFASGLGQSSQNNKGWKNPKFKWYALSMHGFSLPSYLLLPYLYKICLRNIQKVSSKSYELVKRIMFDVYANRIC